MKKLSTYLFLLLFSFQTSSWADDISDFQIEGMSIGDSLLDYFSEEEIKTNIKKTKFKKKNYIKIVLYKEKNKNVKLYDYLQIYIKKNDDTFKISSLNGNVNYKNIEECLNNQKDILKDLRILFKDANFSDLEKEEHPAYRNVFTYTIYFDLKFGDGGKIGCIEPSKEMRLKNYKDALKITIANAEYKSWLGNEAYK